jgi:hypothetical protein
LDDQRADITRLEALDDEGPPAVRRAFVWLLAFAGVILLLPRQVVSAGICFAASGIVLAIHLVAGRRAKKAAAPAAEPSTAEHRPEPPEPSP